MVYAVIDTNIFVSSFLTQNASSATRRVVNCMFEGKIKPLYNDIILKEYSEVLHRSKFHLDDDDVELLLGFITAHGIDTALTPFEGDMPDEDDRVFYEVTLSKDDSFLVTGNLRHFPKTPKVVTAAQMMQIVEAE